MNIIKIHAADTVVVATSPIQQGERFVVDTVRHSARSQNRHQRYGCGRTCHQIRLPDWHSIRDVAIFKNGVTL